MVAPPGYNLSAIKRLDGLRNPEVQVRTAFLGIVALALTFLLNDSTYFWWYVGYNFLFGIYSVALHTAPRRVTARHFMVIAALGHVSIGGLVAVTLYMFLHPLPQVNFGGLILYFCVAMNTLALRIRDPYLYLLDVMSLFLAAAGFIGIEFWRSGFALPTYIVALGFGGFCAYYAYLAVAQNRLRQGRDAARLRQISSEHQRAIGQISAGVAHDFNNLLTVVLGNLELVRELERPEDREAVLREAEDAARRGAKLTAQLLAFSRRANLVPAPIPVAELLAQLEPLAEGMLGRRHRLHVGHVEGLPPLYADSATLLAVLLNLILNAREAMPDGGTIWLDLELDARTDPPMMSLIVNDTGTGIAPHLQGKVFEPFFSTKPAGQGSGLGLPMALGFAEQSGGEIELRSTPGDGTEVVLRLPLAPQAKVRAEQPQSPARALAAQ